MVGPMAATLLRILSLLPHTYSSIFLQFSLSLHGSWIEGELQHNKAFKRDSQRMAFLALVEFSVYGGKVEFRGRALLTP